MFYSSPRDALQEIAAQELYVLPYPGMTCGLTSACFYSWNRNWRYHKELRLWLTKETGTPSSQKVPGGEQGTYSYWDPENWEKARKEMTVLYMDLEEKAPVFAASQLPLSTPQTHQQTQPAQRAGAFQGMGMGAM